MLNQYVRQWTKDKSKFSERQLLKVWNEHSESNHWIKETDTSQLSNQFVNDGFGPLLLASELHPADGMWLQATRKSFILSATRRAMTSRDQLADKNTLHWFQLYNLSYSASWLELLYPITQYRSRRTRIQFKIHSILLLCSSTIIRGPTFNGVFTKFRGPRNLTNNL